MNGTVEPPSSSSTAALTCRSRTPSSSAILPSMDVVTIPRLAFSCWQCLRVHCAGGRAPCRAPPHTRRVRRPPPDAPPKSRASRRKGSVTTVAMAPPICTQCVCDGAHENLQCRCTLHRSGCREDPRQTSPGEGRTALPGTGPPVVSRRIRREGPADSACVRNPRASSVSRSTPSAPEVLVRSAVEAVRAVLHLLAAARRRPRSARPRRRAARAPAAGSAAASQSCAASRGWRGPSCGAMPGRWRCGSPGPPAGPAPRQQRCEMTVAAVLAQQGRRVPEREVRLAGHRAGRRGRRTAAGRGACTPRRRAAPARRPRPAPRRRPPRRRAAAAASCPRRAARAASTCSGRGGLPHRGHVPATSSWRKL